MQPIVSTPTKPPVTQVASELWAYWSQTVEPVRPPVPSISEHPPAIEVKCRVSPEVGRAYAMAATQRFCNMRGISALPDTAWAWVPSSRAHARCARLKNGGLRLATPEPSTIIGLMLLCHELCHAALEWRAPGSLADTERTETFAIAGEVFASQWLASEECPEHCSLALAQALASWAEEREHEFGFQHVALSRFEWLVWAAAQRGVSRTVAVALIEAAWQRAHADCGLLAEAGDWAEHPLICHKPGTALLYLNAWRQANSTPKEINAFRELTCAA